MFFKLQLGMIIATLGSLFGFGTLTGIDTVIAQIMVGSAVILAVAILVIGRWDHSHRDPISHF
jgi:uncharacterized membrane protein YtjA (UPF0391 family)